MREEAARISRSMLDSGLATGTPRNVGARAQDGDILLTPSGLDHALFEPEDVVLVDVEGRMLEGQLEPSSG